MEEKTKEYIGIFSFLAAAIFFYSQFKTNAANMTEGPLASVLVIVLLAVSYLLYKVIRWSLINVIKDKRPKEIQKQDPIA